MSNHTAPISFNKEKLDERDKILKIKSRKSKSQLKNIQLVLSTKHS